MNKRMGRQTVRAVPFQRICWPVKIRVRAEPPLLAPRIPPDFPASPFWGCKPGIALRTLSPLQNRWQVDTHGRFDWRVLGEQDERVEE